MVADHAVGVGGLGEEAVADYMDAAIVAETYSEP